MGKYNQADLTRILAGMGGLQLPQNILDIMVPIHSALPRNINISYK